MARTGLIAAGVALSAVLVLAASCDRAPDCKASPNSPGCAPASAMKTIAPPKPETVAKAAAVPTPRPDPAAGARKTQSARATRHARHGGSLARHVPSYRYDDSRPLSGPVYETGRGQPQDMGCDEACRYRAWRKDYDAWYRTYGGRYAEYPPAPPPLAGNRDVPRTGVGEVRAWSERDRLDPWHGYDGHDGPQNGY